MDDILLTELEMDKYEELHIQSQDQFIFTWNSQQWTALQGYLLAPTLCPDLIMVDLV